VIVVRAGVYTSNGPSGFRFPRRVDRGGAPVRAVSLCMDWQAGGHIIARCLSDRRHFYRLARIANSTLEATTSHSLARLPVCLSVRPSVRPSVLPSAGRWNASNRSQSIQTVCVQRWLRSNTKWNTKREALNVGLHREQVSAAPAILRGESRNNRLDEQDRCRT
jgi:hypothetical protein